MNSGTRKTLIAGSLVALGTVVLARTQKRRHSQGTTDMPQATSDLAIEEPVIKMPAAGDTNSLQSMDPAIE
jgi:hypothetical protein